MILIYIIVVMWAIAITLLYNAAPNIVPIVPLGFIKITTFDRALCKIYIKIVHPKTGQVMNRSMETLDNCIPIWNQVAASDNQFETRFFS